MSLVVVGSVAFDCIKTPNGRVVDALGGSAVHFALAARLFTATRLVGVVGEDFPDEHRRLLLDRNVDIRGLETVPGGLTFRWSGEYFNDMNSRQTLSVDLNVFENFRPVLPKSYTKAQFVFLANGTPSTQMSVLKQVEGKPFIMADTMDLWIQTHRSDLEQLLRHIDGLVLNDEEAFLLSDFKNPVRAGEAISKFGLKFLVIKKGEHGCIIFHEGKQLQLPAYPLTEVIDPTGAGDSFAGGIMGFLASRGAVDLPSFKQAVAWGTVVASYCCEGYGVERVAALDLDAARDRYRSYRQMLSIQE
ncbi:MAG: PfkB family carbohydrate kinase [Planctomycetota bacterium]